MDSNPALAFNLMLRGGAVLLLLLIALVLLRDHSRAVAARLGAAFAVGTAAATLGDAPGLAGAGWHAVASALAAGNMFVFWLFTRALFDDAFALRPWQATVWGGLTALGLANCLRWAPLALLGPGAVGTGLTLLTIVFAAMAVPQALTTWREDLVEGRRRLRGLIVASAGVYAALVALGALAVGRDAAAVFGGVSNAFGLAALSLLVARQLLRLRGDELFAPPSGSLGAPGTEPPAPEPGGADEPDPRLVGTLDRLMAVERIYREPNLSIGALAQRMGLPEHRLRRLINQGLGYRNFSAFANAYRVADAKAALGDAARANVPILSIAMDAGFQSLGPFNRAFKQTTGVTPSEFRRARGGASASAALADSEIG